MVEESDREQSAAKDRDERVAIPLDPEEALRGLLKVDPESGKYQMAVEARTSGPWVVRVYDLALGAGDLDATVVIAGLFATAEDAAVALEAAGWCVWRDEGWAELDRLRQAEILEVGSLPCA